MHEIVFYFILSTELIHFTVFFTLSTFHCELSQNIIELIRTLSLHILESTMEETEKVLVWNEIGTHFNRFSLQNDNLQCNQNRI